MITDVRKDFFSLMVANNNKIPRQLREQEEILNSIKCENLTLGKWLEEFELSVLVEILNASDEYIAESFPKAQSLNLQERQNLAEEISHHSQICQYCKLKAQYDSEWKEEVDESIAQFKSTIKSNKTYGTGA